MHKFICTNSYAQIHTHKFIYTKLYISSLSFLFYLYNSLDHMRQCILNSNSYSHIHIHTYIFIFNFIFTYIFICHTYTANSHEETQLLQLNINIDLSDYEYFDIWTRGTTTTYKYVQDGFWYKRHKFDTFDR